MLWFTLLAFAIVPSGFLNLNTSYVMVHSSGAFITVSFSFKYILCYGSLNKEEVALIVTELFKYILCYGSLIYSKLKSPFLSKFKYILCYGSLAAIKPFSIFIILINPLKMKGLLKILPTVLNF